MTFGEKLKELRQAAGLSQKVLAEKAGTAQTAIGHWETGIRSPSWENVRALCRALGVPCTTFEECDPTPEPSEGPRPLGRPRKDAGADAAPPATPAAGEATKRPGGKKGKGSANRGGGSARPGL